MIESWDQFNVFLNEIGDADLLFHVVPVKDGLHSSINSPSLLFIRNFKNNKTYFYGFDHPDVKKVVPTDHQKIIDALSSFKNLKWTPEKKEFNHLVPISGVLDVGLSQCIMSNKVFELSEFETSAHSVVRRNFHGRMIDLRCIPLLKHLESFNELAEAAQKIVKKTDVDDSFRNFNELIIDSLTETEKHGLAVDAKLFQQHFGQELKENELVYTQYNYYTSTGRPSNRFGGINFAALNKEDGSRKAFVSRFGKSGKLVLIDYSAFHPRIIALLTDYPIPAQVDIYDYLAKLYFNKRSVDNMDIANAKQITFRQLYGGVQEEYSHIKYLSHLKNFIEYNWKFFNENGYVETPLFKRKITNKHIQTPKPNTVFNYILQATEGEISIPVLGKINEYLRTYDTKAILYTYDSILFDYYIGDETVLAKIRDIMSLDGKFPTKVFIGDNYHDMEQVA